MAILNWRDHPRLRFVDFPPPFLTKGSVYIASDRNDSAWMSDGTAYYPLYGSGLEAPNLGVMTWAEKPAPNSVPAGTRFTASDFLMSDWQALNGYWTPVNGHAVVYAPDTTGVQAQSATAQPVAGIPGWQMPADLTNVPNIYIEASLSTKVSLPSSAQQRQLFVGTNEARYLVLGVYQTNTVTRRRSIGRGYRVSATEWQQVGYNVQWIAESDSTTEIQIVSVTSSPIRIYYQGGNTDGSEILNIQSFSLAVGIG